MSNATPVSNNGSSANIFATSHPTNKSVKINLPNSQLSGRIYQGPKQENYFTTRPIKYLFLVEYTKVNVKVDGVASRVLVKTSDLKKSLGVSSKQLKKLQKKGDGSLRALVGKKESKGLKSTEESSLKPLTSKRETDKTKQSEVGSERKKLRVDSSLRALASKVELQKVKQIRQENKYRLSEGQIARKQDKSYITIKTKKREVEGETKNGKIKVFKNLSKELGSGSFKTVSLYAKVSKTSIKKIAYAEVKPSENIRSLKRNIKEARQEFLIGRDLYDGYKEQHGKGAIPFVKYYQAVDISKSTATSQPSFGMLMEHCDTNLRKAKLSSTEKGDVFLDILKGVAFMNNAGYVHRDLKRDNIMIKHIRDENGEIIGHQAKIIDFGLSDLADDIQDLNSFSGTRTYSAPEAFIPKRFKGDAKKLDSWSLGVILYKMHFDTDPEFKTKIEGIKSEDMTYENKVAIVNRMSQFYLEEGQGPVVEAIAGLLKMDPNERWSAQEALEFLSQAKRDNGGELPIGFD